MLLYSSVASNNRTPHGDTGSVGTPVRNNIRQGNKGRVCPIYLSNWGIHTRLISSTHEEGFYMPNATRVDIIRMNYRKYLKVFWGRKGNIGAWEVSEVERGNKIEWKEKRYKEWTGDEKGKGNDDRKRRVRNWNDRERWGGISVRWLWEWKKKEENRCMMRKKATKEVLGGNLGCKGRD